MKPTNPMTQLQQWKDNRAPVNGKHVQNCERNCETAKLNKTQRTLDNTGFIKRNCETGCEFTKVQFTNNVRSKN